MSAGRIVEKMTAAGLFLGVAMVTSVLLPNPALVTTAAGVVAAPREIEDNAWVRVRSADGIRVFRRLRTINAKRTVRAEAEVEEPLLMLASLLLDLHRAPEWLGGLVEVKTVRSTSDTDYVLYARFASGQEGDERALLLEARLAVRATPAGLEADLRPTVAPEMAVDKAASTGLSAMTLQLTPIGDGRRTRLAIVVTCARDPEAAWCANSLSP